MSPMRFTGFLDLTRELRDQIYNHVTRQGQRQLRSHSTWTGSSHVYIEHCISLQMLLVSKQIHDEYFETASKNMTLVVALIDNGKRPSELPLLPKIPATLSSALRTVNIRVHYSPEGNSYPTINLSPLATLPSLRRIDVVLVLDTDWCLLHATNIPRHEHVFVSTPSPADDSNLLRKVTSRTLLQTALFGQNRNFRYAKRSEALRVGEAFMHPENIAWFTARHLEELELAMQHDAFCGLELTFLAAPRCWESLMAEVESNPAMSEAPCLG